jgi:Transmembrane secretion effector
MLSSISAGAEIVGPVLAGVTVATAGPANAVTIDSISFFAAAAVRSTIRSSFRALDAAPPAPGRLRTHVREAIDFIRANRTVATLLVVGFGNSFTFGVVLGLLMPYAVEELVLASDDGRIGILYGAIGIGSLVSGLMFSRLFRRRPREPRSGAATAVAAEGEVVGVEPEPVVPLDPTAQRVEHVRRQLDDRPAVVTHQMVMGVVGEVVHGRAVAEVNVVDHTQFGEGLQRPVHRRQVDLGLGGPHCVHQRIGRDVFVRLQERRDDRSARHRDPPTPLA